MCFAQKLLTFAMATLIPDPHILCVDDKRNPQKDDARNLQQLVNDDLPIPKRSATDLDKEINHNYIMNSHYTVK